MNHNNSIKLGASVPNEKAAGQTAAESVPTQHADFNDGAAFLQVLMRIAAALEKHNELVSGGANA